MAVVPRMADRGDADVTRQEEEEEANGEEASEIPDMEFGSNARESETRVQVK
jgi:hypothetical protein